MREDNATPNTQNGELRTLSEHWGRGLLSTDEAVGWLLAYLARQSANEAPRASELKTQNSELKTPSLVLGTLLRQIGDTVDALAGSQLELWRTGDLWHWRWQDTGGGAAHGLRSLGEAFADAVEQRHPATFPAPGGDER
ncbi:MAG TPA: hypothetical protein VFS21_05325 [Roseiflexaceae bacterium]|nr:hypothetical protein [Roseiflexaceae bacterium]